MRNRAIAGVVVGLLLGAACLLPAASAAPHAATTGVNPSDFVRHVTNPFFPLAPGTVITYRGVKDGRVQDDRVVVTHQTKRIIGVTTTVVLDSARHAGRLLEQTEDWYAQDKHGNVWYFGERTKAFDANGNVDTAGSWEAGVHGAEPGIIMEADPHAPDGYRQELFPGHAMDQAWVLRRGGATRVPYGEVHPILVTLEWSPLEPTVIDRKVYARGIGIVRELSATGPRETLELVGIHR
jgi:hypothetical protein